MHYEWRFERRCKYCPRPPIAIERLEPLSDGRLAYRFKRPWRDGTSHVVFTPLEFLEKLSAIVPAPKTHLVRYSGILGPAAKWRPLILPQQQEEKEDEQAVVQSVTAADSSQHAPTPPPENSPSQQPFPPLGIRETIPGLN